MVEFMKAKTAIAIADTVCFYCAIAIITLMLTGAFRDDQNFSYSLNTNTNTNTNNVVGSNTLPVINRRPCDEIYVVGEGETLHTISDKCGDPFIVEKNPHIHDPDDVFPGLVIKITPTYGSEEVLAYYCLSQLDLFRSKRVIELGSGYGLAGLLIAAVTEAVEVVISNGNPQVVDYIQRNIDANSSVFGDTKLKSMMLHWSQDDLLDISNSFDIIVEIYDERKSACIVMRPLEKELWITIGGFLIYTGLVVWILEHRVNKEF